MSTTKDTTPTADRDRGGRGARVSASTTTLTNGVDATTGYLLKLSQSSAKSTGPSQSIWKRRWFMLKGCTLTYYSDHQSMGSPKGELLIFGETKCEAKEHCGQKYCLTLSEPFAILYLACEAEQDLEVWVRAFDGAIDSAKKAVRSFMYKYVSSKEGGSKRKYFILHQDAITFHRDDGHINSVQGLIHLNDNTYMEYYDNKQRLTLVDTSLKHTLSIVFNKSETGPKDGVYAVWKTGVMANLKRYNSLIQNAETSVTDAIKQGILKMRPPKGGDVWPEYMFYINDSEMIAVDQSSNTIAADFKISPNCSVFETSLGANTFELVTAKKVLHVQSTSPTESAAWIESIREAISRSYLDTNDPLFQHAMLRIDDDVFYKVTFSEKKPLGVVFERTAEWAAIKTSNNQAQSGIKVGSVLSSINGVSVILESYQSTIDRLKDWKPPLTLEFRVAPTKSGYLLKESKSRNNPAKRVWKKRYFSLAEGKLSYYDSDEPDAHLKGETQLLGSVVSLVTQEEVGRQFCFRVMSGMTYLTLQSATERQMMDWASAVYHAISIANGGAYILGYERDRRKALEDPSTSDGAWMSDSKDGDDDSVKPGIGSAMAQKAAAAREKLENAVAVTTYEDTSALEQSIVQARSAGVDTAVAESLLEELEREKKRVDEVIDHLVFALQDASIDGLTAAVQQAEGLGLSDKAEPARRRLAELKTAEVEEQLQKAMASATIDSFDQLAAVIEVAKASKVDVGKIVEAHGALIQLKTKKADREEKLTLLRDAQAEKNLDKIKVALDAVQAAQITDPEVEKASQLLTVLYRERIETDLSTRVKKAHVEDIDELVRVISDAETVRASPAVITAARNRIAELSVVREKRITAQKTLVVAIRSESIEKLVASIAVAEEAGFVGEEIETARAAVARIEQIAAAEESRKEVEERARLAKVQSERDQAISAIEAVLPKDLTTTAITSVSIADIRRVIEAAAAVGVSDGDAVRRANATIEKIEIAEIDSALQLAVSKATLDDFSSLAEAVAVASQGKVSASKLNSAKAALDKLRIERVHRDEVEAIIDIAISSNKIAEVEEAISVAVSRGYAGSKLESTGQILKNLKQVDSSIILSRALKEASSDDFQSLAKAVSYAEENSVDAAAVNLARDRLQHLQEEKERREAAKAALSTAIESQNIVTLERATAGATAVGLSGTLIDGARSMLNTLKEAAAKAVLDAELKIASETADQLHSTLLRATVDSFDDLARAVEIAKASKVDVSKVVEAQSVLITLKQKKSERDEAIAVLEVAKAQRDLVKIQNALDTAAAVGAVGAPVETAIQLVNIIKRENAESELALRCKKAQVEDIEELARFITDASSLGASSTVLAAGRTRIADLTAQREQREKASLYLTLAVQSGDVGTLADAINEAEKAGCPQTEIQFVREALEGAESIIAAENARREEEERVRQAKIQEERNHAIGAIEDALRREPPSLSELQRALQGAAAVGVSVSDSDAVSRAAVAVEKILIAEAEALLQSSIRKATVDDFEFLAVSITTASHSGVSLQKTSQAKSVLDKLRVDRAHRDEVEALLKEAITSNKIDMVEEAIAITEETGYAGKVIDDARRVLKSLKSAEVTAELIKAVTAATADDFKSLVAVLKRAENEDGGGCDLDKDVVASARALCSKLEVERDRRDAAKIAINEAFSSQSPVELEKAISEARHAGLSGVFVDGALSMLDMLKSAAANTNLKKAIEGATVVSFINLRESISAAKVDPHADKDQIVVAEKLLEKLVRDERVRSDVHSKIEAAVASDDLAKMQAALQYAQERSVHSEVVDSIKQKVAQSMASVSKDKLLRLLKDVIKMRSIGVLERVTAQALEAGFDPAIITQAQDRLVALKERERLRAEGKEVLGPNGLPVSLTGGPEDDDGGESSDTDDESDKLAAEDDPTGKSPKKARKFFFKQDSAKTEADLRRVFETFGNRGTDERGTFMISMQFSNIWRKVTGEKGNLFKEMQMFKRFDANNRGALYIEDFLEGWARLSIDEQGQQYIARLRTLGDD